jgi:hypothetical protein
MLEIDDEEGVNGMGGVELLTENVVEEVTVEASVDNGD